jgi:hypothetical protein
MNFKIVMPNNSFLWSKQPPVWTPAMLASKDHIEEGNLISRNLQSFPKEDLELIAVIGGLKFFDLIAKNDFRRVTLYDRNINEVTNFIHVFQYLQETPYEQFDSFVTLNGKIQANPGNYYLPECIREMAEIAMPMGCQLVENSEYRWTPTRDEYERVRKVLCEDLNDRLYLDFPDIDVEGRKVAVFMPNYAQKPKQIQVQNAALIIPIYTRKCDHPKLSTEELREIAINNNKKKRK